MKTATKAKPFTLDINLNDKEEVNSFWFRYVSWRPKKIATALKLRGKGSTELAESLVSYACHKKSAILCREKGDIKEAVNFENICDSIYTKNINPVLNSW